MSEAIRGAQKRVIMGGVTARTPSHSNNCSLTTKLSAYLMVLSDAAGLQRLTASPTCSLDESQPSLTGGRRFGSTALPLLFSEFRRLAVMLDSRVSARRRLRVAAA